MGVPTRGRIFVSYRRRETSMAAGRLTDRLIARFGKEQVFIDVDSIQLGVDFRVVIQRAVAACEVLLAVIGPHWLTTTDRDGRQRLDDPEDVVRLEIEAALKRDIPVVPVLVEGAVMPRRPDLPESLAALASRNALTVRHESFGDDVGRLIDALEQRLDAPATVPESSVSPAGTRARGQTTAPVWRTTIWPEMVGKQSGQDVPFGAWYQTDLMVLNNKGDTDASNIGVRFDYIHRDPSQIDPHFVLEDRSQLAEWRIERLRPGETAQTTFTFGSLTLLRGSGYHLVITWEDHSGESRETKLVAYPKD